MDTLSTPPFDISYLSIRYFISTLYVHYNPKF
uniref:Uncharacterized protein n=1 Tax=Myoviridae sp. ctPT18 TaxID=2825098 RepID=A0A8S5NWJ0_9CAUD|nr:MAG TPA: hypothetical protein [Myoviridae sp. ctPT18]